MSGHPYPQNASRDELPSSPKEEIPRTDPAVEAEISGGRDTSRELVKAALNIPPSLPEHAASASDGEVAAASGPNKKENDPQGPAEVLFDQIKEMKERLEQLKQGELTPNEEEICLDQVRELLVSIQRRTEELEGRQSTLLQKGIIDELKHQLDVPEPGARVTDNLTLHVDGDASMEAIVKSIRAAERRIDVTMFIWKNDTAGQAVAKELYEAAMRGVEIAIHKDRKAVLFEQDKSMFHRALNWLERTQVTVLSLFNPDKAKGGYQGEDWGKKLLDLAAAPRADGSPRVTIDSSVRKDHSKVFVFDGKKMIIGGVNMSNQGVDDMHDYMVEVDSPAVVAHYRSRLEGESKNEPAEGASIGFCMNTKSDALSKKEVLPMMLDLIRTAKRDLVIQMAYFGDPHITESIIDAVKRGVNVRIITSEKSNIQQSLNAAVLFKIFKEVDGRPNLAFYLMRPVHAKLIHADETRTLLGSANMNTTATEKLSETSIYVNSADSPFTKDLQKQLAEDMENSREVRYWHQLPRYSRFVAWVESLFAG